MAENSNGREVFVVKGSRLIPSTRSGGSRAGHSCQCDRFVPFRVANVAIFLYSEAVANGASIAKGASALSQ